MLFFPFSRHLFLGAQARLGNVTSFACGEDRPKGQSYQLPSVPGGTGTHSFSAEMSMRAYAACGPERAAHLPEEPPPLDTRALRPGVFFFSCSGDGIRRPARASGRRGCRNKDFVKNAADELFQAGVFFLTPGRTNGKLEHFPPSEESSSWTVFDNRSCQLLAISS
jgi:hypothetical protein